MPAIYPISSLNKREAASVYSDFGFLHFHALLARPPPPLQMLEEYGLRDTDPPLSGMTANKVRILKKGRKERSFVDTGEKESNTVQ